MSRETRQSPGTIDLRCYGRDPSILTDSKRLSVRSLRAHIDPHGVVTWNCQAPSGCDGIKLGQRHPSSTRRGRDMWFLLTRKITRYLGIGLNLRVSKPAMEYRPFFSLFVFGLQSPGVWAQSVTEACRAGWEWVRSAHPCSPKNSAHGFRGRSCVICTPLQNKNSFGQDPCSVGTILDAACLRNSEYTYG